VNRTLKRTICAALLGGTMLATAAPAANAADHWDRASQDFGSRSVGTTSDPQTFALVATCDAFNGVSPFQCLSPPSGVHSYGAITVTGSGFAIDPATDVCNARGGVLLTPNIGQPTDVCTLQVTFKPTSGGVVNGTLSTTTSPTGTPLKVALKGIGVATATTGQRAAALAKCKAKKKKKARKKCRQKAQSLPL
jgi:hypothetical protein